MAIPAIQPYSPQVTKPAPVPAREAVVTQEKDVEAAPATPAAQPSKETMSRIIEALEPMARNLQFSIDDATGRTVVKVLDAKTKEVIRQIPSEDLLELTRSMSKLSGLFIKQKV